MRSMWSIFAYYFAQMLIGLSPIHFSDSQSAVHMEMDDEIQFLSSDSDSEDGKSKYSKGGAFSKLNLLYLSSALLDICGYVIRTIGMVYCGSGLFQVAFSSVAVFSALYSRVFLKTYISSVQWLGIIIVTGGLVISPLSSATTGASPVTGILLTLLGAQFYAVSYIVNEIISRIPGNKGSKEICKRVGIINTAICCLVICVDTLPNRNTLIFEPIAKKNATITRVFQATLVYIVSHIVHSYALYSVQGSLGAIWTGLLQCIRACVVFVSSHYLYCSTDPNQCLTTSKIASTVLVCVGILVFTTGKQKVERVLLPSAPSMEEL